MDLNYDSNCPICEVVREDNIYTIYRGDLNTVVLNPRWSPHLGRSAVVPHRHLGEDGQYPIRNWTEDELKEMGYLEEKTANAQIKLARYVDADLRQRDGVPLIDRLIRPGEHPNLDLIPQTTGCYDFNGEQMPKYLPGVLLPGSSGIKTTETIVGSFSGSGKNMPHHLIWEIRDLIRDFW